MKQFVQDHTAWQWQRQERNSGLCLTVQFLYPPPAFPLTYICIYTYISQCTNTHACLCMNVYLSHTGHTCPLCTQTHIPAHCANIHLCTADTCRHGVLSMDTQIYARAYMLRSHNVHSHSMHTQCTSRSRLQPRGLLKRRISPAPLPLLVFNCC